MSSGVGTEEKVPEKGLSEKERMRLLNWYIKYYNGTILLCGDYYDDDHNDKPVYIYGQFGFVSIEKLVSAGFQALCIGNKGEKILYSCRWDLSDKYFGYTQKLLPKLESYQVNMPILSEYLGYVSTVNTFEGQNNKKAFDPKFEERLDVVLN